MARPIHTFSSLWRRLAWVPLSKAAQNDVMARFMIYFYWACGGIIMLSQLAPSTGRSVSHQIGIAITMLIFGVIVLSVFDRMTYLLFNCFAAAGSILVSALLYWSGVQGHGFRALYLWIILYSAYFFRRREVFLQLTVIAIGYAWSLGALLDFDDAIIPWAMSIVAFAVLISLIYSLRVRLQLLLTQEHQKVEVLEESGHTKDEAIAVISHELRTPLSNVYGAAVTLQRPGLGDETHGELVGVIRREAARLATLINSVLWTSRVDADRPLATEPFDCATLLAEVIVAVRAGQSPESPVHLVLGDAEGRAIGDRDALSQVLTNLLDNAIRYSPKGGNVTVTTRSDDDHIQFEVSDQGIGISAEHLEKVFEKFYRAGPVADVSPVSGTGLGLYVAQSLVRRMGGEIEISSEPGRGSTFTFSLPSAQ